MASGKASAMYRDLDLIAGAGTVAGMGDAELLARFAERAGGGAEAAFEALVARHGAMVRAVCLGVLRDAGDADDAFQATFLVLVRKAGSVRVADSLGPWLYGVARRVATRARADARKRRAREARGVEAEAASADPGAVDVRPIVLEELARLPEGYRSAVVLCHLEGKTHEEAARQLRWPVGTLSGRLSRARDLLRSRLARRGLGVSATTVAAALVPKEAPASLVRSTAQAATRFAAGGTVPSSVLKLTQGVLTAMFIQKLKLVAIAAASVAALSVGVRHVAGQAPGDKAPAAPATADLLKDVAPPSPVGAGIPGLPDQGRPFQALRNGPGNLPRQPQIQVLDNDAILTADAPDGRSIRAMNINQGNWQEYPFPEGVKVIPILSPNILALAYSGPEIREVAAFNPVSGGWNKQALREPARGGLIPQVWEGLAFYRAGRDIYAFSGRANRWGVLHLEGGEEPLVVPRKNALLVQQGKTLHVFSLAQGMWTPGVPIKAAEATK